MAAKFDQLLIDNYLERAVAEFNSNPLSQKLIRRIANELPELFMTAALPFLESSDHSSAHHLLAGLAVRQPFVYEEVANPARGPVKRSVTLVRRFLRADLSFDVKLARKLPDRNGLNHSEAFDALRSCRVLEVLDEISVGRRLIPILGHLVESADRAIAAKATLFIGRRMQSPDWAARQMTRANPEEVRANAVESLWGVKSASAQNLLEDCVSDDSSRVAGNALVGLHKLGKPGIVDQIHVMVTAETAANRSTAAWTMGKIGDAAFVDPLTELLKDEHPDVRSAALRSLLEIRRTAPPPPPKPIVENPPDPQPVPEPAAEVAAALAVETLAVETIVEPVVEPVAEVPVPKPVPVAAEPDFEIRLDGGIRAARRWGRKK